MDKLIWFKFIISDWMMGKIMKCPEVTQARFIRLCCLYWNKDCQLTIEDAEIEIDKEHLDILSSKKIVIKNEDTVSIKFLNEQKITCEQTSKSRREAVLQRWNKVIQPDTNVLNLDTNVIQNDTDKKRVDKIRIDKSIKKERKKERKKDMSAEKADSVYSDCLTVYNNFILERTGVGAKINGVAGNAMKNIISFFKTQVKHKPDGSQDIVQAFSVIFQYYDRWETFHKNQLNLNQIEFNLINIINSIKNGHAITEKQTRSKYAT